MPTNNSTNNIVPDTVTMDLELLPTRLWLSGGGTLSVDSSFNVGWSGRLLAIGQGRSNDGIVGGYIGINLPSSGTVTGEGGASSKTVVASGIPLAVWDTLYFVWQPGVDQRSVSAATNFRVVNYTADLAVPANWILLAQRHGDTGLVRFATGHYLGAGETLPANNRVPSGSVQNADMAPMLSETLKGNALTSSASPQDLSAVAVRALLNLGTAALADSGSNAGNVPLLTTGGKINSSHLLPLTLTSLTVAANSTALNQDVQVSDSECVLFMAPSLPRTVTLPSSPQTGRAILVWHMNNPSTVTLAGASTYNGSSSPPVLTRAGTALLCVYRGFNDWRVLFLDSQTTLRATVVKDLASLAPGQRRIETFAVSGVLAGATAALSPSSDLPEGLVIEWVRCSAAGTVAASFWNSSAIVIDPLSQSWSVAVIQ